jgi:Stress responsive A/B Barrel Domain
MIRHTILFKTKSSVSQQAIENACANFLALKNKLPGIMIMMGGECELHEGKGGDIFTHAFSIDFKNRDALNSFLSDPITHPAKDGIVKLRGQVLTYDILSYLCSMSRSLELSYVKT